MKTATILLPNYNNEKVLPFTFEYLRKNVDCSKVSFLMVDDGSEDESVAVAKREIPSCNFASCEIIELKHQGVVVALNEGLKAAKTEIIVRIDGDATIETPGWLPRLTKLLECDEVGMVGGKVLWESGQIHSFGRSVISELGLFDMGCVPLEPIGSRTYDSIVFRPQGEFSHQKPYEVDTILGVCVAFRKSEALSVGGFDMTFNPVWIEDDDFGLSLRKIGKRLLIEPAIHIVHRPSLRGSRQPTIENQKKTTPLSAFDGSFLSKKFQAARKKLQRATLELTGRSSLIPSKELADYFPKEADLWRASILQNHYKKWKVKWGFDPLNPDINEIYHRYWDTAICWKMNPAQYKESQAYIKRITSF
jgi:GT2 family glycosyltransferase